MWRKEVCLDLPARVTNVFNRLFALLSITVHLKVYAIIRSCSLIIVKKKKHFCYYTYRLFAPKINKLTTREISS